MAGYLLIESRDPLESREVEDYFFDLAASLGRRGEKVTLFLVQNGVFPARRSTASAALEAVAKAGVEILADDFSLRERGIPGNRLAPSVHAATVETVVDRLAEGRKALWH